MKTEKFFDLPDGGSATLYKLRAPDGFGADISDFGGVVTGMYVPDRDGGMRDVVLGWKEPAEYLRNEIYFGALIGRVPNRIGGGRFTLDGRIYQMILNDMDHSTLHGGFGYSHRRWHVENASERRLTLTLSSPDGDAGFPGRVEVRASYALLPDHTLELEISAESDRLTVADFTNHSYFNLNGENSGRCRNHFVRIAAERRTAVDSFLVPTGETPSVAGTRYDLRTPRSFERIFAEYPRGFDDNFILGDADHRWKPAAAEVYSTESGIRLTLHTSRPGVQFYMSDCLRGVPEGKSGEYVCGAGFCLETQNWPDAVNHPEFPPVEIAPGRPFHGVTRFQFSTFA